MEDKDPLGGGYESHLPPEGINITNEHPLKEFSSLILAGLGIVVCIVFGLTLLTGWLAPRIPFSYEQSIAENFSEQISELVTNHSDEASPLAQSRQIYLEQLIQRFLNSHAFPEDIKINVHYVDDDMVNAFATLGGNIFIHRGLFDVMTSENSLVFVLGHEIGHVSGRHPIISMGRGTVVFLALSAMLGLSDAGFPDWLVSQTTNITMLSFSRKQEISADFFALNGMQKLYGNVNDANALFRYLEREEQDNLLNIEVLQTHPLSDSRIEAIRTFSLENKQNNQRLVMIPKDLQTEKHKDGVDEEL